MRRYSSMLLLAAAACAPAQENKPEEKTPVVTDAYLAPPAEGTGWQWVTGKFEVPAGMDLQQCYFFQVPGEENEDVFINKIEIVQNTGTHHMNIFRVRTIYDLDPANGYQRSENGIGPCFDSHNWSDWPLVINSQTGGAVDWTLPNGVAHKFKAGEWVMLQSHYVNADTQGTPGVGDVYVNFHKTPAASVQNELGTLFATKQSIRVCRSDDRPKFAGTCQFDSDQPVHVIGANGHFHSRGERFEMFAWDGVSTTQPPQEDLFYVSENWEDPPMMRSPELDLVVQPGGGIYYTCEFSWDAPPPSYSCDKLNAKDKAQLGTPDEALDCCYTFGGPVDWAEHCNVFAYYYPKTANVLCY